MGADRFLESHMKAPDRLATLRHHWRLVRQAIEDALAASAGLERETLARLLALVLALEEARRED